MNRTPQNVPRDPGRRARYGPPRRAATWMLLVAALVLAGCTNGAAGAQETGTTGDVALAQAGAAADGTEGITVVGEGTIRGVPDTVEATLGVEVRRDSVQAALDAANEAARELTAALRDAGVNEADIQTIDVGVEPIRSQPEIEAPGDEVPATEGYLARNRVRVTIEGVEQAGSVLEQAVTAAGDAATLDSFVLALRGDTQLVAQAREEAFAHARRTAEQYAEIAGVELGALAGLTETGGAGAVPLAADTAEAASAVPISPGTQNVTVRVTATWALR